MNHIKVPTTNPSINAGEVMKSSKMLRVLSSMLMVICLAFFVSACEGPEGPAGEDGAIGPIGPKGDKGDPGDPGADGTAGCITCHDMSTELVARLDQWRNSQHNLGGNFERNGQGCNECHTHEGFREFIANGAVAGPPPNPTAIGCRTCHNIHTTWGEADYSLAVTGPTKFRATYFTAADYNKGNSNICVTCHQPRNVSPFPTVNGPDVTITSSRYGPHHGPQGSFLVGAAGYEVPGSTAYPSGNPHGGITDGCITCHMAAPFGRQSGGHTMRLAYEYHGSEVANMAGCVTCHPSAKNFDINGFQTDIEALGLQLADLLKADNILQLDGDGNPTGLNIAPLTLSANKAGALYNWKMIIIEDRSKGVHNPGWARALLENSIENYNN